MFLVTGAIDSGIYESCRGQPRRDRRSDLNSPDFATRLGAHRGGQPPFRLVAVPADDNAVLLADVEAIFARARVRKLGALLAQSPTKTHTADSNGQ